MSQDIKQAMLAAARRKPVLLERMLAQAMIPTMAQTGSRVDDILKMKFHLMATTVYKSDYGDMELVSLRTDTAKTNKGRCSGGQQHYCNAAGGAMRPAVPCEQWRG